MAHIPSRIHSLLADAARMDEEFVTELRQHPEGWWAVGGLALLALLCWTAMHMYRREGRAGSTQRVRLMLGAMRCLVLVMLAVIALEPVRVRIMRRWVDSYTIVLADSSSSMDLSDVYREEERGRQARELTGVEGTAPVRRGTLLEHILSGTDRAFLRSLAGSNRVRLYSFDSEPQLRGVIPAAREGREGKPEESAEAQSLTRLEEVAVEISGTGASTNVERAVRRSIESVGSAPVAGVVVLSDGGFNDGAPAEDVARFARERRIPVFAVGVGDPSEPRNVRVTEVTAPENVFQKDPFAVQARFATQGVSGEAVRVELHERSESTGSSARVVDTRTILVGPSGAIEPITFQRSLEQIGRVTYSVEIPALTAESVTDDNIKQVTVNIIDSKLKVLVISGSPSWDYRYLTRLLQRDETVDVSCWLQSADVNAVRDGDVVIDHLPALPEELFGYDVIVLMDPQYAEFSPNWAALAEQFVTEHGGGVLFAAARARTPAFLREAGLKALKDILPVTLDPEADLVLNQIGHYQLSPSALDIPASAFGHPIMQIAEDPTSSRLLWQGVGDVYWHYPVLREKPVATVLMRHGDPRMRNAAGGHVLAAVQFVGAGRTGFLAFDGTWRWRRGGEALFDRFWVQYIRYLAEGKLLGGAKRGLLLTDSEQYSLGESVTLTARLLNDRFEPVDRPEVSARFEIEEERGELVLTAQRDRPGWFEGRFVPRRTGAFRVTLEVPGGGRESEVSREVLVSRPNIEVLRPQMDRPALVALAEGSAGGRYFDVHQAGEIAGLIPDLHEEIPVRSRPVSLWDHWVTLMILVGLLSVEWFVRKWNRML